MQETGVALQPHAHWAYCTEFFNDENISQTDLQDLVESFRKMLQAGWRAALPWLYILL